MFLLSKLLPLFVLPLGVSLILMLWGLARHRRRWVWAGVIVLLVSSNPIVERTLMRAAEDWAERRPVASVPAADAVVVLSAGRVLAPGSEGVSEWTDANRFFGGVDLMRAERAPLLMFTGAWISPAPGVPSEGEVLAAHARALGIPDERLAVTGLVMNTADEAREVASLLRTRHQEAPHDQADPPRVLLVTSAFHMRRARQLFEQQGLEVEPFPVSFWSSEGAMSPALSVLPSVRALSGTQTALRELYGRVFYWLAWKMSGGR